MGGVIQTTTVEHSVRAHSNLTAFHKSWSEWKAFLIAIFFPTYPGLIDYDEMHSDEQSIVWTEKG